MSSDLDQGLRRAERIGIAAMMNGLATAGASFAELVGGLSDDEAARPVPGLSWTAGDTAAHMLTILNRVAGDRRRADSLAGLAELNETTIAEIETRRPSALHEALVAQNAKVAASLAVLDDAMARSITVHLHAGVVTDIPSALSYVLFDLLVHGHDIASATGRSWVIDPALAALALRAGFPILVPWIEPAVIEGEAQSLTLGFGDDGDIVVLEAGEGRFQAQNHARADGATEVDPAELLLALSGRVPAASPVAARIASWFQPI